MPRQSSIKQLPDKILKKIHTLKDQGRSLDEIIGCLDKLDIEISRSALGRYTLKRDKVMEQIRTSREMAKAIAQEFGDETDDTISRTNIEMLHSIIMKGLAGNGEEDIILDAKEAMFMATALEKVTKASKLNAERVLKIREEAEKAAIKKASDIVETTMKEKGLSAEMAQDIKIKFLGIKDDKK